jgi:hypothetical protein
VDELVIDFNELTALELKSDAVLPKAVVDLFDSIFPTDSGYYLRCYVDCLIGSACARLGSACIGYRPISSQIGPSLRHGDCLFHESVILMAVMLSTFAERVVPNVRDLISQLLRNLVVDMNVRLTGFFEPTFTLRVGLMVHNWTPVRITYFRRPPESISVAASW